MKWGQILFIPDSREPNTSQIKSFGAILEKGEILLFMCDY